jgi:ankyrin repeat protein
MGKRIHYRAGFYIRRGNRKQLGRLIRRHEYLKSGGRFPLVYWVIWLNPKLLRWLLEQGVDPDARFDGDGNTALMQAAAEGDLPTVKTLLQFGADPNARNDRQERPLGYACTYEQWQAAEQLIDGGADVNGREEPDKTHLDWMEMAGNTAGIKLLRSRGGLTFQELESAAISKPSHVAPPQ